MQLTPHFADTEPGLTALIGADPRIVANVVRVLTELVEPIRNHFNAPVRLSCSWRTPAHNAAVGGKSVAAGDHDDSYHLCEDDRGAVDICEIEGVELKAGFDWVRLESKLPFDEVILEVNADSLAKCIHLQLDGTAMPRRWALLGQTGACEHYVRVSVN